MKLFNETEMSAFHEILKKIFIAVDGFLCNTLKNESLGKNTEKEKTKLLELLQKFYTDYDYLSPRNVDEGSSSSSKDALPDESRNTVGSNNSNEDEAYSDNIPDTTVKALADPLKYGFLTRGKQGRVLFSKQKSYCVLHKNAMYWFKKPGDKKQQNAFFVSGYEFRDIPQTEKDISKKEFPFELICTGKRSYQFIAESKEELDSWKESIEKSSKYVVVPETVPQPQLYPEETGEDVYEPIQDIVDEIKRAAAMESSSSQSSLPSPLAKNEGLKDFDEPIDDECFDEIYDAAESVSAGETALIAAKAAPILPSRSPRLPPPPITSAAKLPQPDLPLPPPPGPPPVTPIDNDTGDDEIYEFVDSYVPKVPASSPPAVPDSRSSIPTSPPPLPPQNKPSNTSASDPPPLPSRSNPSNQSFEKPAKVLPPIPDTKKRSLTLGNANLTDEDYENLYYGIWKCLGSTENELSFDEGEIIHVINKELDNENWWVGELRGKIGLVPKPFLCQAFEIVA